MDYAWLKLKLMKQNTQNTAKIYMDCISEILRKAKEVR